MMLRYNEREKALDTNLATLTKESEKGREKDLLSDNNPVARQRYSDRYTPPFMHNPYYTVQHAYTHSTVDIHARG